MKLRLCLFNQRYELVVERFPCLTARTFFLPSLQTQCPRDPGLEAQYCDTLGPRPKNHDWRPKTLDPRPEKQDPRPKTQDPRLKTQDSRLKTQDSRLKTREPRTKTQTQDPRPKTQGPRPKTQDPWIRGLNPISSYISSLSPQPKSSSSWVQGPRCKAQRPGQPSLRFPGIYSRNESLMCFWNQ